jgi:hypothetical protein
MGLRRVGAVSRGIRGRCRGGKGREASVLLLDDALGSLLVFDD